MTFLPFYHLEFARLTDFECYVDSKSVHAIPAR